MYHFRDVICYKCKHKFLHMKDCGPVGSEFYEYYLENKDELLVYATCPKCSAEVVLIGESHIGVDPNSDGIKKERVRGI